MKRSWRGLGFVSAPRRAPSVSTPFHPSFQCRRDFSTTFTTFSSEARDEPTKFHSMHNQRSIAQIRVDAVLEEEAKFNRNAEPTYSEHTKVYWQYLAAVNGAGDATLPLEVHQAVLRACTPPTDEIRAYTARLLQEEKLVWHQLTHPHESRFRRIMQNIIGAGFNPSPEDLYFILSQFAAVGHFAGIQKYMQNMGRMGLEPDRKMFGFLLQALAHRVSLPASASERPTIVRKVVDIALQTIREMIRHQIPPAPMNLDLAFRLLTEVHDPQGLAELLKLGYGMDLSYLDSPPIDAAPVPSTSTPKSPPEVIPLSTSALNSLIEALGRWGQISKMVYVFETVTTPLPVPAKPDNAFDDDDDDFLPIQQEWKPPSPKPNTTSFNTLIHHCAARGYPALAKHYAAQLMHEEHMTMLRLRNELREKPLSEVAAPRLAVTIGTLRPVYGLANRTHDVELLRWVVRASKLSVRRKYRVWTYYDQMKSKYDPQLAPPSPDTPATPEATTSCSPKRSRSASFDVLTHLGILKKDMAALSKLNRNASTRLFDTINRTKARLGRRVWEGKDVFMRDEEARVVVDREVWKEKVNFKKNVRGVKLQPKMKKYLGKNFDPRVVANTESSKP
jgi:pentatricopeptide repeat protein